MRGDERRREKERKGDRAERWREQKATAYAGTPHCKNPTPASSPITSCSSQQHTAPLNSSALTRSSRVSNSTKAEPLKRSVSRSRTMRTDLIWCTGKGVQRENTVECRLEDVQRIRCKEEKRERERAEYNECRRNREDATSRENRIQCWKERREAGRRLAQR